MKWLKRKTLKSCTMYPERCLRVASGRYQKVWIHPQNSSVLPNTRLGYKLKPLLICHSPKSKMRGEQPCREEERRQKQKERGEQAFLV
jgi:hypothetical protein